MSTTSRRIAAILLGTAMCWMIFYHVQATTKTKAPAKGQVSIKGTATDTHGRPITGATVYFVDSTMVNTAPITTAQINSGAAAVEQPLEDVINNPANAKLLFATPVNSNGQFMVKGLNGTSTYFPFVMPATTDTNHLPGGDISRIAFSPRAVGKTGLNIQVSWNIPSTATYLGSSTCLNCHSAGSKADATGCSNKAHALMVWRPNQDSANQNAETHEGSVWTELASKFTAATAYNKPLSGTTVKTLSLADYSASASPVLNIYEDTDTPPVTPVYLKLYLWHTAVTSNNNYFVTFENVANEADPNNFTTFPVPAMWGGYIRQTILINLPGQFGMYKLLTYQAETGSASQGLNTNFDRTRKRFNGSPPAGPTNISTFYNPATKLITLPKIGSQTSVNGCASCHIGFGTFATVVNSTTGETLSHTVPDANGFDLSGSGVSEEADIGCEQCHGPGSAHKAANLASQTASAKTTKIARTTRSSKTTTTTDTTGEFIVNPGLLCADRASLVCGRCHEPRGILVNETGNYPLPGISRAQFVANYVTPTNLGAQTSNLWPDAIHEKGGHQGFAYVDYQLSVHARNSTRLIACDDCHDPMTASTYRYMLKGDPDDSTTGLCTTCHAIDVTTHVPQEIAPMDGQSMLCIQCHMCRTGKGGAGRVGLVLGTPTGLSSDANIMYWENDQSSHVWDIIRKFDYGVAGVQPASAMPTPYTNSCGICHNAAQLQFQSPTNDIIPLSRLRPNGQADSGRKTAIWIINSCGEAVRIKSGPLFMRKELMHRLADRTGVLLGLVILVALASIAVFVRSEEQPAPAKSPPPPQAVPATDSDLIAVGPPPFSPGIFPCSGCHDNEDLIPNTTPRQLKRKHKDIVLHHDEQNRWCLDCHDANNRDKLHLASGKLIDFTESYKLCGQCHGPTLRDWKAGEHGKRTGMWSGQKQYLLCATCHNPHSPKFKPLAPKPPPVRPEDLR